MTKASFKLNIKTTTYSIYAGFVKIEDQLYYDIAKAFVVKLLEKV